MRIGFDISHWQGNVDFDKMRAYPDASFVIMKASQGTWEDPKFAENWLAAKGKLSRGGYHFYDNRYPPKEQARKFFDVMRRDLEGPCILDLEDRTVGAYSGWRAWFDFLEELKLIYPGARIVIYSNFYYIIEMLSSCTRQQRDYFAQYPFWLASYQPDPFSPNYAGILCPLPWLDYLILQSGTPAIGMEAGVESLEIDYNIWRGTEEQFAQLFKTTEPEEPMTYRYEATSIYSMSVRPDHNTSNTPLGSVSAQSRMEGNDLWEAPGEKWLYVLAVNGSVRAQPGWVAIMSASRVYCSLTDNQPAPPADDPIVSGVLTVTRASGAVEKYNATFQKVGQ